MDLSAVKKIMADQPNYRQRQVYEAVYRQLISSWDEATVLPLALRQQLTAEAPLAIGAELAAEGTAQKAIITLTDGAQIEAVLIKNTDGRQTVCVSSQVGCALGCVFCATGQAGFKRNLTAAEIVEQVLLFARWLNRQVSEGAASEPAERVDNVVFMGMGEPFLNWPEVKRAIEIFNDPDGFNIAARSISISTCGLPDGIKELAKFPLQVNLAVSLHAPNDELRRQLMPIANSYNLKELFDALSGYLRAKGRKVMFEYMMIAGVNDGLARAEELAELLKSLPRNLIMVNLIPHNPIGKFKPSPMLAVKKFRDILFRNGIETTIRKSRGGEVKGACGQLAGKGKNDVRQSAK